MCGGLGYINIFHTDAHRTTIDDWGCGNSAQDQYYQKWYADMGHCDTTGQLPTNSYVLTTDILLNITEEFPANCVWGEWEDWSACSESCASRDGTGDQTRAREVATEEVNGGVPCEVAEGSETQSCSVTCPGKINNSLKSDTWKDSYVCLIMSCLLSRLFLK